jgi:hypothetical protein
LVISKFSKEENSLLFVIPFFESIERSLTSSVIAKRILLKCNSVIVCPRITPLLTINLHRFWSDPTARAPRKRQSWRRLFDNYIHRMKETNWIWSIAAISSEKSEKPSKHRVRRFPDTRNANPNYDSVNRKSSFLKVCCWSGLNCTDCPAGI